MIIPSLKLIVWCRALNLQLKELGGILRLLNGAFPSAIAFCLLGRGASAAGLSFVQWANSEHTPKSAIFAS